MLSREAELQTIRAWLAVEAGDTKTARQELEDVTARLARPYSMLNKYRSYNLASDLLQVLRANDRP
jgi:hypothetical protein